MSDQLFWLPLLMPGEICELDHEADPFGWRETESSHPTGPVFRQPIACTPAYGCGVDTQSRPTTLAELRASGWTDRTVKEELRDNLVTRLQSGARLFDGIVGFDDTVLPALERAVLAGHDIIFLGERGQAKTRLIRLLVDLLDDEIPIIEGCEINDSPYRPVCAACRHLVAEEGESVAVRWVDRTRRFGEKLATPDTAVADLIGDVDPIKVAEGRHLADELTIHFGLVPRTNRGIIAINELPDLPTRIQVSLLNVLEERDIQIRGYTIRLPLDVLLVASANPEDYTNRGRIITPLKDRFGSEVRTHYPRSIEDEIAIMLQESHDTVDAVDVTVPEFLDEILAEFTHLVRASSHINQRSGVSVRFSVANRETVIASAARRALRTGAAHAVARVSDLPSVVQSSMGRIEFEVFEEGREHDILDRLLSTAILEVFRNWLLGTDFTDWVGAFNSGMELETGDLVADDEIVRQARAVGDIDTILRTLDLDVESPAHAAAGIEFVLEGLHLSRRLNKTSERGGARYRG